ncbi:MAG TPA: Ig-like domain-containing protein [Clostridia bacterium]|nr:Ig-like domain-containing protein [Clostridia bacterium]
MKPWITCVIVATALVISCTHKSKGPAQPTATAHGTAIVESSGGKQVAGVGSPLDQPVVVQVNDKDNNPVPGAPVRFSGPAETVFTPAEGVTDSSGQFSTNIYLGGSSGRYRLTASTWDSSGKRIDVQLEEVALGYQQMLGHELNEEYCARCHDSESTALRVSNHDNLGANARPFTEGDPFNKLSDADLTDLIAHGGVALGRSAEMPPWGYTLTNSDIAALVSYIRAVSDPPYRTKGVVYVQK